MRKNKIPVLSFEKWAQTGKGKKSLDLKTLTKDPEYLKNRLWWAYHAGQQSGDIAFHSEVEAIFQSLLSLPSYRLPVSLKNRVRRVIENKSDYTIDKL